jgi:hypothetical protein
MSLRYLTEALVSRLRVNNPCIFSCNVVMDRSWMKASRLSDEYDNGVTDFLQFAERNLPNSNGMYPCPCVKCGNRSPEQTPEEIRNHLICEGISQNYTTWIWHGESWNKQSVSHVKK